MESLERALPSLDDVYRARELTRRVTRSTPLLDDLRLDQSLRTSVVIKAEHMQRTGSFKFRGIYHRVACLTNDQRKRGLVTMSSGNAAQALALAARLFDCPCTVVTFADAAATKLQGIKSLGANISIGGDTADELMKTSQELVAQHGWTFVHPFDDPDLIAGHGAIALEMIEQGSGYDAVLVPTSGGGLLSATALVFKSLAPETRVYGVQPEEACGIYQSFVSGKITSHFPNTIADGLRAQRPGEYNFALIKRFVDDILLVPEVDILPAMALVWNTLRTVIEPSAAIGISRLMTDRQFRNLKVGVITTGSNVDLSLLIRACEQLKT
jgi:threonine dehydratase